MNKFIAFLCLSTLLLINLAVQSQEIQSVNVSELSNSEVQKAKETLDNSGLSREAAVQLARQKGATEQQIQEMLQRMDRQSDESQVMNDPLINEEVEQITEEQETSDNQEEEPEEITDLSQRSSGYSSGGNRFGSYLFNSKNLTFEPNPNLPTPKNYIINTNDQIIITIWGNSQAAYQLTVNRNGQILLPDVGPIYLSGLSFEDAEEKLKNKLSSIYADMNGKNPKTFAQIDLGKMRSISVNLIGEINAPGNYTLPATATLFNALYLSGGPSNIGSFRNIQIIRNNKVYKEVDIYEYLINGTQSENQTLQNEDIIFVPTAESQIKVSGEFKRNALFELKPNETINDLLVYAGGYTDETYRFRMKIYRKTQEGLRIIDFTEEEQAKTKLEDGDMLVSEKISDLFQNRVTINGSVYRPGEYEWYPGMKLSELITKADSITADVYTKQGHIIRYNEDLSNQLIPFNVNEVLNGTKDYELLYEDLVTIKSHFQLEESKYFAVNGHVISPNTFNYMDNVRISDAIYLADGLKEGYYGIGHIIRTNPKDKSLQFIKFSIDNVLNGVGNDFIQNRDIITIKADKQMKEKETITVSGEVISPNTFSYMENMSLKDAIYMANGFKEGADSSYIEVSRRLGYAKEANLSDTLRYTFYFTLPRELSNDGQSTAFLLKPYDRVSVRKAPGYRDPAEVTIVGEVKFAGQYSLNTKNLRISDLIVKAGGLTADAYPEGAQFQRKNDVLGTEIVGVELNKILSNPNKNDDLILMDGDILLIPQKLQTVKVSGNVLNPLSLAHEQGRSLKYYINKSGGFNDETNRKKVYVKYPNGTTATSSWFIFRNYPEIKPGTEIIVPKKPEKTKLDQTGKWLGIASTLSTLAVALNALVN